MDNMQKQEKYIKYFNEGDNVLELGSGRGDFLRLCAKKSVYVVGVDRKSAEVRNRKFIRCVRADFVKYLSKTKAGSFNGVYARHVVEHLDAVQLVSVFKNIKKALKKSGVFIAIFPNVKNVHVASRDFWKDDTHVKPYAPEFIIKKLKSAGFEILDSGQDNESYDYNPVKRLYRKAAGFFAGVDLSQAPDIFVAARKK